MRLAWKNASRHRPSSPSTDEFTFFVLCSWFLVAQRDAEPRTKNGAFSWATFPLMRPISYMTTEQSELGGDLAEIEIDKEVCYR